MRVVSVVGARPNFMKLAPVARALRSAGHEHHIVHTGQHYDPEMSRAFFEELEIPPPELNLGIGSGSHAEQTAAMLVGLERMLLERPVDWVLAYGDTNSALATVLAAVKLHTPIAHVEAGLRSHNRLLAEEVNRVVADHLSNLLLAPTRAAVKNLETEGLIDNVVEVGDVMVDLLLHVRDGLAPCEVRNLVPSSPFLAATLHRPINTDDRDRLSQIVEALSRMEVPVILPAHPRLRRQLESFGLRAKGALQLIDPLPYRHMVALVVASDGVITDSGGLQKEAFVLGKPVTTLRSETPWPETLEGRRNILLGGDLAALSEVATRPIQAEPTDDAARYGAGKAAERIVQALQRSVGSSGSPPVKGVLAAASRTARASAGHL
jgi:UDP-N-acetylglucosamine 2-epimerase (non-hydrolysing)